VDMRLEVIVLPVGDVDRSKQFYLGLGWREDADRGDGTFRLVQLTPTRSPCSIQFGVGLTSAAPGSAELYLAVDDIEAARTELAESGAPVSEIFHEAGAGARFRPPGAPDRAPGPDEDRQSYRSYVTFDDPDGNRWIVQEVTARLPGRTWGQR
jgi:catechol 2,3-dioxygenase-like lactoylglutathione lyase family enzyme